MAIPSSLCLYAQKIIPSKEISQDIVQEVFYKIWKNRKKLIITTSFRNFLITAVKNECLDYLRKNKNINNLDSINFKEDIYNSPEEIYTLNELKTIIEESLNKLPEQTRSMFKMNRFDNMTYSQIAQETGFSIKTVEAHISKTLKFLKQELTDYSFIITLFL